MMNWQDIALSRVPQVSWRAFSAFYADGQLENPFRNEDEYMQAVESEKFKRSLAVSDESRGLGDTVAKITHATGLDKLAELYTSLTGKPCGCAGRQDALNKLFPYGVKE